MARTKKIDLQKLVVDTAMLAGGAFAGNQITSFLETQDWNPFPAYSSGITAVIGIGGAYMAPGNIRPVAQGVAISGLLELAESLLSGQAAANSSVQTRETAGMGYTPQVVPAGKSTVTENGAYYN